jgi:hypothetical protein
MRTTLKALIMILPLLLVVHVNAHGITEPRHGGLVKVVGDVSLELVNGKDQVSVYILDDNAWDTSGMSGKIKVESSVGTSEFPLTPNDDSGFTSEGATIPAGSKVLVIITKADGYSKIAGRFEVE